MFAQTYVFDKQSLPPFHCGLQKLRQQVTTPLKAYLLPKLRYHFAEFLNWSSPKRLRILFSSTCVGLRYGLIYTNFRSFSWKHRITHVVFITKTSHRVSGYMQYGFSYTTPYSLKPGQPNARLRYLSPSLHQTYIKYGNINPLSIHYAFRPRVRIRLTLGGVTWPRNPWIFGGRDSRPPYRYLSQHQLLCNLQRSSRYAFVGKHNAPLPLNKVKSISSVLCFSPVEFSAQNH